MITLLAHYAQAHFPFRYRARAIVASTSAFFAGQFVAPLAVTMAAGVTNGLRPGSSLLGMMALAGDLMLAGLLAVSRRAVSPALT